MGCHTFIYKKITDKDDLKKLIDGAIVSARMMIDSYNDYEPGQYDKEIADTKDDMIQYWQDVKNGLIMHDPDFICHYFIDGRWVVCDEMTFDDVINGYNDVITTCDLALLTYDSFDELKQFIISHSKYYGFYFEERHSKKYWEDTTFLDDERLHDVLIIDNEIYARSEKIENDAFKNTPFFRVEGYPCGQEENFYKGSPDGRRMYAWSTADDLIEFLEWYKTTKQGNKRKPSIDGEDADYDDRLYNVIRKFFKVNEGKNLLVHFG